MELKIHPIQANILKTLLFEPKARFSKLNVLKTPTDHFNFHLKRLVELKLIEKVDKNNYSLTAEGKEFANRFDTEAIVIERQPKIGVLIIAVKGKKYLIQQRLKQPYFGFHGFITGKVRWGETLVETTNRELQEETGLKGKLTLVGIKHKMDYSESSKLLEDKLFFVSRIDNLKGDLLEKFEGGKNLWLTEKEILKLPDLFDGVKESIRMANQKKLAVVETKYKVKKY
ncbi:MAG: NUDIX domain-containing protein [bacterium]|nr:NUDIX domain-containing protein [bacterium]